MNMGTSRIMAREQRIRVSIVEDEPEICRMLQELLRQDGNMELCSIHGSAEDAMERLPDHCPDVVVMDINLPGRNGIECVRQLRTLCPQGQFLMFTVHDDDQRVFEALKAGANGYILKGSTPDEVLAAIRELHGGGAPMSAPVARRVVAHLRPAGGNEQAIELTLREKEVLDLLAQGLLYKEIADSLAISMGTIKQHIHRIYEKLHVQNRTEAVVRYFGH
jgi:DNA-binding NarL/FixJ family response regulator